MARKKNISELLSTPFSTSIRGFTRIAEYYLYFAPGIDSKQASQRFSNETSEIVFSKMIAQTAMEKNYKIIQKIKDNHWKEMELGESKLDFEKPRFVCDYYPKETKLNAILRHIRNSLAHGSLYVWKKGKGNFLLLIDYDKKGKKPTAKIVISDKILEKWMNILQSIPSSNCIQR